MNHAEYLEKLKEINVLHDLIRQLVKQIEDTGEWAYPIGLTLSSGDKEMDLYSLEKNLKLPELDFIITHDYGNGRTLLKAKYRNTRLATVREEDQS